MTSPRFENIGWTVGSYCNARCSHCYSWQVRRDSELYLTEAEIDRVIAQLISLGIQTVNIGGNEPIYTHGPDITRTKLPLLLRRLADAGLPVGITTNGVTFRYLAEHHPDELRLVNDIDFSLDSPYRSDHDGHRCARLFGLVVESIQQCHAIGIDCSITACATRDSFQPRIITGFLDLAALLGCELRVNALKPVDPSLLPLMPTRDAFFHGFAQLMAHTDCITLGESCLTAFTGTGGRGCPCGISSFRVNGKTAEGTVPVGPCIYVHEFRGGDILAQDLSSIVNNGRFGRFTGRQRGPPKACRDVDCPYTETCRGGCTARAWFVNGSLDARDPYCPLEYLADHGGKPPALPKNPPIGLANGLRVHDNYLCTWIGRIKDDYRPQQHTRLADFHADPVNR